MARRQRSYPPAYREKARALRREGMTYSEIVEVLGGDIPKNTLSDWVRDVELTADQQARIRQIERDARARGRPLAAEWHREQKRQRLHDAEAWATPIAERVAQDTDALMLMAAALWLGEGTKKDDLLEFSNSNPQIILGWMELLHRLFGLEPADFSSQVLIGQNLDEQECLLFWTGVTGIPLQNFHKSSVDSRTSKRQREGYHGVCRVTHYSADLRRKLGSLAWQTLNLLVDSRPI